ncbi:P-loop containing nucleoside triphosphate hydrolase protein [Laetiporus sulphureus 93-53]|uniref:p-loop containing nucleoside triphosphate hydrolase protein n=1 Tax=Laetiporus sulphureus 93-53 TaxID=1314785 RepID=A0A165IGW2_9APHY|nr:P-loop containing nucleoside triphosphate hydrolase protein [Laetiporus sulphureus 93-53]KZT13053.1 P-loop containing nucleoside triphosphate hydrolase protein [Laetiporus sulphureus 93-53]
MSIDPRMIVGPLEDAFVKVTFEEDVDADRSRSTDPFYDSWVDKASSAFSEPSVYTARALRKQYRNHSLVLFADPSVNLLGFPGALIQPLAPSEIIESLGFLPSARRLGGQAGTLAGQLQYGAFKVAWDKYDFILYVIRYVQGLSVRTQHYLLHEGPEAPSRALLMAAGAWKNLLHEEILIFNSGFWKKSHELWIEVQKANWDDVILKQEFKDALKKDINGFFSSESLYKSLAIPWKRGLIMYGPPGNGKTISMKAVMKECDAKGYAPLYVKSFKSYLGEEGSMAVVFEMARSMAPCVLVLEDLDSLINDSNRSFFLNQLDGLEGNDGLLVIGSTNHFDKLDPALSGRPSRFDRKYSFDDPDEEERALYAKYWQNKLKSNESIEFPDSLVHEIAVETNKFSFAYLKEAFVSALVLLAGYEDGEKPSFASVLKRQIKSLRSQLDKKPDGATPSVGA